MSRFNDDENVRKSKPNARYSKVWNIQDNPDFPGIYRCQTCGFEDVINRGCNALPPCSNCKKPSHANKWKLLVRAEDA